MTATPWKIERWDASHPCWADLLALIEEYGQTDWFNFHADWHLGEHVLAASIDGQPVGFLRFVVQRIGDEDDHEPVTFKGVELVEAKVIAFAVHEDFRRKGIGQALQEETIRFARELGCYQLRSFSGGDHPENHALKLAMGFAVQPVLRHDDTRCVYFILPLQTPGTRHG